MKIKCELDQEDGVAIPKALFKTEQGRFEPVKLVLSYHLFVFFMLGLGALSGGELQELMGGYILLIVLYFVWLRDRLIIKMYGGGVPRKGRVSAELCLKEETLSGKYEMSPTKEKTAFSVNIKDVSVEESDGYLIFFYKGKYLCSGKKKSSWEGGDIHDLFRLINNKSTA